MIRKMNSTATRLWQFRFVWRGYADGRNRVAVGNVYWTVTQGSLSLATLGAYGLQALAYGRRMIFTSST